MAAHDQLHRGVLQALALALLAASAVLFGINLYFHILGFLGGTARMSVMPFLVVSTIAIIFIEQLIRRSFSELEEAADFPVPRTLRWARRAVTTYCSIVFLCCLLTNASSRGDVLPPRWLVAIPALPMVVTFHVFTDAVKWLLFVRGR